MLEVVGLRKSYGPTVALAGVDLDGGGGHGPRPPGPERRGQDLARLDRRGAAPGRCRARARGGVDVDRRPRDRGGLIGLAPQETGVYPPLTVRENLQFFAGLAGLRGRERRSRIDEVGTALGLDALLPPARVGALRRRTSPPAHGHRVGPPSPARPARRTDDGCRRPHAERDPGAGPTSRRDGSAIVYSTHYLHEIEALDATVVFLDRGRIVATGRTRRPRPALRIARVASSRSTRRSRRPCAFAGSIVEGARVRIPTDDPARLAAGAARRLGARRVAVRAIEVVQPSLESVFLAVTGRRYDSAVAEPAA